MANIDNLNFKVILDDKDFNTQLERLKKDAKEFNTSMSNLLDVKRASQSISSEEVKNYRRALQMKSDEVKTQEKINREKIKTEGLQRKINAQIERASKSSRNMATSISDVTNSFMQFATFAGVASLVKDMVRITGEFELQRATLGAMLDDMAAAEHLIGKIKKLAVESPFTFGELTGYAKQLTAFAIPEEELFDTTKMLADLSAGLGVAADRLILAYGQVKSAAFLRGQEVRQFTEAGIPILQELAKEFEKVEGVAISVGEVFDRISTRQVSFEMIADVLKRLTSEGGKFYNMQEVQANTLWGKMRKLKDQWEIALNELGQKNNSIIHGFVDGMIDLVKNIENVAKVLTTLIVTYGAYKAAMIAAFAIQKAMTAYNAAKAFITTMKAAKGLTASIKAMNISLKGTMGAIGIVGGLLLSFALNSKKATDTSHDLTKELEDMHAKSMVLYNDFDRDIERLKNLTKGTQTYRDAINEINNTYRDYLPNLISEADSLEKIEENAKKAKDAILEKTRQETIAKLTEERDRQLDSSKYTEFVLAIEKKFGGAASGFLRTFHKELEENTSILGAYYETWAKFTGGTKPIMDSHDILTSTFNIERAGQYVKDLNKWNEDISRIVSNTFSEISWGSKEEYTAISILELDKEEALLKLKEEQLTEEEYRNKALKIEKEYLTELIDTYERYGNITMADKHKRDLQELENFWKSWRGQVQDLLLDKGLGENKSYSLWPTMYTSSKDYVEQLVKDYKEVSDLVDTLGFDPNQLSKAKEQKQVIEAIADLLNIDLTTGKSIDSGKEALEREIDALSALKKGYDALKKLNLSDTTIVKMLKERFPDIVSTYGNDFIGELNFTKRILDLGNKLKQTDPDRAHSILQALGLTTLDQDEKVIEDALSAAKKYFDSIRKWKAADFNIEGEGAAFDVGKVANSLSNKFEDIKLKADKLKESLSNIDLGSAEALESVKNTFELQFGKGTWDAFYEEFITKGEAAIDQLAEKERDYERKLAQEKLNDLASRIVNDALEGVDMSHWGDKSINQIEEIRQRLSELMTSDIVLPESTIQLLEKLGLTTADLQTKIKELFGAKYSNATTEKFKALSKVVKEVSSLALTLGNELIDLGDALGDESLSRFGRTLVQFEKLATALTECDTLMQALGKSSEGVDVDLKAIINSSDFITLAIKLAATAISSVINGINESQQALKEARLAAIEYESALKQLEYNEAMKSYSTIFGTDEYKKAEESMKLATKYQEDALATTEKIGTSLDEVLNAKSMSVWAYFSKGARNTADLLDNLGVGDILVDARTKWQKFWGTGNELLKVFNISDFIDEEGNLMGDKLREVLNTYGEGMSAENKEALTEMMNDYDLYVQAVEDTTTYLNSLFGNVADSMADAFIESFKASGEAALDYADIMDEVATNIAKSVVKSMIIDEIADPDKIKQMAELLPVDPAGTMSIFDDMMQRASELAPYIQQFLESMQPYFNMEDEAQTLGNGIKGITEDTANLLASYLNAIRADVSYARTIWERMDANTQQIAAMLSGFSAPSFMEYQAQIAANTYNTSMNTLNIMLDLRSVMTSEGGQTAIRTIS